MILYDFTCRDCSSTVEILVARPAPDEMPCECGGLRVRQFPCPAYHAPFVTVEAGSGPTERPPHALDTRPLAEGMSWGEWKQQQKRKRRDEIDKQVGRDVGDYRTTIYGGKATAVKECK